MVVVNIFGGMAGVEPATSVVFWTDRALTALSYIPGVAMKLTSSQPIKIIIFAMVSRLSWRRGPRGLPVLCKPGESNPQACQIHQNPLSGGCHNL